jgi:hypothetical protein
MLLQLQKTSPDNCLAWNTFTNQVSAPIITCSKTSHTYYDKTIIENEKQEAKKYVVITNLSIYSEVDAGSSGRIKMW